MPDYLRRDIVTEFNWLPAKSEGGTYFYNVTLYNPDGEYQEFPFHCGAEQHFSDKRRLFLNALADDAMTLINNPDYADWCDELCFDPESKRSEALYSETKWQSEELERLFGSAEKFVEIVDTPPSTHPGWAIAEVVGNGNLMALTYNGQKCAGMRPLMQNNVIEGNIAQALLDINEAEPGDFEKFNRPLAFTSEAEAITAHANVIKDKRWIIIDHDQADEHPALDMLREANSSPSPSM